MDSMARAMGLGAAQHCVGGQEVRYKFTHVTLQRTVRVITILRTANDEPETGLAQLTARRLKPPSNPGYQAAGRIHHEINAPGLLQKCHTWW